MKLAGGSLCFEAFGKSANAFYESVLGFVILSVVLAHENFGGICNKICLFLIEKSFYFLIILKNFKPQSFEVALIVIRLCLFVLFNNHMFSCKLIKASPRT